MGLVTSAKMAGPISVRQSDGLLERRSDFLLLGWKVAVGDEGPVCGVHAATSWQLHG